MPMAFDPQTWHKLTRATALLCFALSGSCKDQSPSISETYSLTAVNGQPVPATIFTAHLQDGRTYEFQATSGDLSLFTDGHFTRVLKCRRAWDGVVTDSAIAVNLSGRYDRTD